jgi:outer membrane protein OmpA-like peptidoglycan-associated protein
MSDLFNTRAAEQEEHHWLSVSDLMAGLMVVFLFIAIALMRNTLEEQRKVKDIAVAYQETQVAIYEALMEEFEKDLDPWNAHIDRDTLTFTFNSPDILFEQGKEAINWRYRKLLSDFFPRYIQVLDGYTDDINEMRIEGHTSSVWNRHVSPSEAYFLNMQLSQGRTRNVLEYVYGLDAVAPYQKWLKGHVAAVGFSSSRPIENDKGKEDGRASRRVTFRVITNAEIKIKTILETVQ